MLIVELKDSLFIFDAVLDESLLVLCKCNGGQKRIDFGVFLARACVSLACGGLVVLLGLGIDGVGDVTRSELTTSV